MLERLIHITNSADYIRNYYMFVTEVFTKRRKPSTTVLTVEIGNDNNQKEKQIWEIVCKDIYYNVSNKIHEPKVPFKRLNIYHNHPVLWNYQNKQYITLIGRCTNISQLIGDLFIIHNGSCGDWVDFHSLVWPIERMLNSTGQVKMAIPTPLFDGYALIFKTHKLEFSITESEVGEAELKVLIFGNSDICSDLLCCGQPYIVAKNFEERLINEYQP